MVAASDLFSSPSENPRAVRVVVFLSNGRDMSSESPRESAARYARERSVRLYAMGVGEVFQEAQLREAVESTGGGYYSASDLSLLQEQLQILASDLRGQYQLTYITLRRTGEYETRIVLKLRNLEGDTVVGPFDMARFFGPDNRGEVVFDPPSFDVESGVSTVFMRSLHVPRNIDRIRFKLDTSGLSSVDLVAKKDGGLLEGWTLSGPDAAGYYDASSQTPLEFGNVGLLFALTFSSESIPDVPVEFDNTIYTGEKSLRYPQILAIAPLPPLTGRIAFSSTRGSSQNIYVMNADGSNVTQLTHHLGGQDFPRGRRTASASRSRPIGAGLLIST